MTTLLTYPEDTLPTDLDAQVLAMSRTEYPAFYADGAPRPPKDPATTRTCLVLMEGPIVVSYLEIPSKRIRHGGHTYRASGLSSVLTHQAYRHRGYGRQIVTAARELIAAGDADIGVFTCDPPLVPFYTQCGWTLMERSSVVGGTRAKPFPAASLGKCTLMGFFTAHATQHRADFESAPIYLELGEGDLW